MVGYEFDVGNGHAWNDPTATHCGLFRCSHRVLEADAQDRPEADQRLAACIRKYHPVAPELAEWLEQNVPESLTVFCLPQAHRVRMRRTNLLENFNKEVKRRTRVATLLPNEASCLRPVSAVLMELSEEWETGKVYLNMNVKNN